MDQAAERRRSTVKENDLPIDRNPIAQEYELVKKENGLLVSVKK